VVCHLYACQHELTLTVSFISPFQQCSFIVAICWWCEQTTFEVVGVTSS
jgi:hypothetical protein